MSPSFPRKQSQTKPSRGQEKAQTVAAHEPLPIAFLQGRAGSTGHGFGALALDRCLHFQTASNKKSIFFQKICFFSAAFVT